MIMIIGGSGSGKSCYAENIAVLLSQSKNLYYIATMHVYDEEGHKKVERHRNLRKNKGFVTIEQPVDIDKALEKMKSVKKTVLLECISNLVANEMFLNHKTEVTEKEVTEKIINEIEVLKKETTNLIVVSNNIFEDGMIYDKTTMEYIKAMGNINQKIAAMSDKIIEVVVGIPIVLK